MDKLKLGLEIIHQLTEYGFEAYIVGGAVRDYVLGIPIEDVDLTTSATYNDIVKIFSSVAKEGEEYHSCRIYYKDCRFDVTTFRKDISYIDHRHPQSIIVHSLKEDLSRRDFTMNAMVMNDKKDILDAYHGLKDIKNKVIRMIGNPKVRFDEDGLRVLRALDFSSRFNFCLDDAIMNSFSTDYVGYLKEEYIVLMIKKIVANPYPIGLMYIVKYQILRGYPFYQVVCEEAYSKKYRKHIYALFYSLHNFLPTNIKISKQERKLAKDIAYFVRNDFNDIALYYGNLNVLEDAIELDNILKHKKFSVDEIYKRKEELPIHSPKDIDFDWSTQTYKNRGKLTKLLEEKILNKEVKNKKEDLKKFLKVED